MRALTGRQGAFNLSEFIDLCQRHAYLPVSVHRSAVEGHAEFLPDDALTIMFGDYEEGRYFTLRVGDVPEWSTSAHDPGMGFGDTKFGWKKLLTMLLMQHFIRPSDELMEVMGTDLWNLTMRKMQHA